MVLKNQFGLGNGGNHFCGGAKAIDERNRGAFERRKL